MTREEMREKVARAMKRLDETSSTANDVTWHDLADAAIALIRPDTLEDAARKVPTTWLDPLLTGPGATELPLDGPGVEKLCRGIAAAIRALKES